MAAVDAAPLWVVLDGESPLVGPIAAWRMANGGFEEVEISSLATTAEARGGSQVLVVDPMQGEPPESNRQWSVFIFGDPDASDAAEEEVRRRHGVGVFPAPTVVKVEQDASVRIVHLETPPLD